MLHKSNLGFTEMFESFWLYYASNNLRLSMANASTNCSLLFHRKAKLLDMLPSKYILDTV